MTYLGVELHRYEHTHSPPPTGVLQPICGPSGGERFARRSWPLYRRLLYEQCSLRCQITLDARCDDPKGADILGFLDPRKTRRGMRGTRTWHLAGLRLQKVRTKERSYCCDSSRCRTSAEAEVEKIDVRQSSNVVTDFC